MYLGVEIGGTKLQIGFFGDRLDLTCLRRMPVDRSRGSRGILRQIEGVLAEKRQIRAVGVGFGGPVDSAAGRVIRSHHVAGWTGFRLRRWFEKLVGAPAVVENDTKCAALAEARLGAGRGKRVVFYSNIGTGIGGGLVIGGQLYNGRFGSMEIGHTQVPGRSGWGKGAKGSLCGWHGTFDLESVASGLAIERGKVSVEEAARWYGLAIANAITLLNPDVVVIGGGVSRAGARFWVPFRRAVREFVFGPFGRNFQLLPAALGEEVVVIGAALLAAEAAGETDPGGAR